MKNKETIRIHKAWKEIKSYIKRWGDRLTFPGAKDLKTFSDFKTLYKSATTRGVSKSDLLVVRKLKSTLRFRTALRTAKAAKEASARYIAGKTKKGTPRKKALRYEKKEITGKSLSELRKMSTRDIADLHKEDIKKMYHDLRAHGMDSTEAAKEISSFYFGS